MDRISITFPDSDKVFEGLVVYCCLLLRSEFYYMIKAISQRGAFPLFCVR